MQIRSIDDQWIDDAPRAYIYMAQGQRTEIEEIVLIVMASSPEEALEKAQMWCIQNKFDLPFDLVCVQQGTSGIVVK